MIHYAGLPHSRLNSRLHFAVLSFSLAIRRLIDASDTPMTAADSRAID
jgi:hypothetical protein